MPQPLRSVKPDASVTFSADALVDRPQLANLVTRIFGLWAIIEQEQQILFMRVVDSNEDAALAVYSILKSDGLQRKALDAAAKAKFGEGSEDCGIFTAIAKIISLAAKHRNRFAHCRWGISPEIPDAVLLADPDDWKAVTLSQDILRYGYTLGRDPDPVDEAARLVKKARDSTLVYRITDLEHIVSELEQCAVALYHYGLYLRPLRAIVSPELQRANPGRDFSETLSVGTSAEALRKLQSLSLYRRFYAARSKR